MPYAEKWKEALYLKGYYAGWRIATIHHLGGKCVECGEDDVRKLTIDHDPPLLRRARSQRDLEDLSKMKVLCLGCHKTENWGKRQYVRV